MHDIIPYFGEILAGIVLVASLIFEKVSTKVKPWSLLLGWLGERLNQPIAQRLDSLEVSVAQIRQRNDTQDEEEGKYRAKQARRRIIIAADEIVNGIEHSSEWFKDVLYDVSDYNRYCTDHPKFQNHEAVLSIEIVESAWRESKFSKGGVSL